MYACTYVCMYSSMNIRTYVRMKVRTCLEANKCMMYLSHCVQFVSPFVANL